jgi:hypothetical protein
MASGLEKRGQSNGVVSVNVKQPVELTDRKFCGTEAEVSLSGKGKRVNASSFEACDRYF